MNDKTIDVPMTLTRMGLVCQLIEFAWQNGNIRDPQTGGFVQDMKALMQEQMTKLSEEINKNVEKPKQSK